MARKISDAVAAGNLSEARKQERNMARIMYSIYGGKSITCWLSGLKWTLVQLGVFGTWKNVLGYPLTPACKRDIKGILKHHSDEFVPWKFAKPATAQKKSKRKA
jgi:hypothetical protein